MKVVIGGREFQNFTGGRVSSAMNAMSRDFTLDATTRGVGDVPFRKGQTVQISIEDSEGEFVRVLNGFVESISMQGSGEDVSYSLTGRDLIGDLVDSNLDGVTDVGQTVKYTCESILKFLGIKVKVIDLAGTSARPFEPALDIVAPDPSDTGGEFLMSVAQRRQALLMSDGDANLLITEGIGRRTKGMISNHLDGHDNNLLTWSYTTDNSRRFGIYTTEAQSNIAAIPLLGSAPEPKELVAVSRDFRDPAIRTTRRRSITSESSYPSGDAIQRARWEANLSRTEGTQYSVVVNGFLDQDGNVWEVNTAPLVHDEFAGIEGRMLIQSVTWAFSGDGETTSIGLTEVGAFQTKLQLASAEELSDSEDEDEEGEVIP